MIEIDGPKALDLMAQVVEGREDYVYEIPENGRCVYANNGAPSCLVGQALALAGVPVPNLAELDDQSVNSIAYARLPEGLTLDADAREFLRAAQSRQDDGETWGQALAYAEEIALAAYTHKDGAERP